MTPLKQQISLIPFSIELWYSPYKGRHFENRSDQTFCILLIKNVLSVIESANLCRCQNLKQKWSGFEFGLIWIWMSVKYPFQNCGSVPKLCIHSSASFISPSLVDIGCWLYENWENREMLTNVGKSPIAQWGRKLKKTGIHAQIQITNKSQPPLDRFLKRRRL